MSKIVDISKKIENTVVGGYQKVEDKFVDTFLKKEGETIKEAKARLQTEQKKRNQEQSTSSKTTEEIQMKI